MSASRLSQSFVILRAIVVVTGFVALWTWAAQAVRRYDAQLPIAIPAWLQPFGLVIAASGAVLAASCVAAFATRGRGTPAPFDPPREFVASGPYRYVRNPMYVGALSLILGVGLAVRSCSIVLLALFFFLCAHLFVLLYEEPTLRKKFGDSYLRYCATVHRWRIAKPSSSGDRGAA